MVCTISACRTHFTWSFHSSFGSSIKIDALGWLKVIYNRSLYSYLYSTRINLLGWPIIFWKTGHVSQFADALIEVYVSYPCGRMCLTTILLTRNLLLQCIFIDCSNKRNLKYSYIWFVVVFHSFSFFSFLLDITRHDHIQNEYNIRDRYGVCADCEKIRRDASSMKWSFNSH